MGPWVDDCSGYPWGILVIHELGSNRQIQLRGPLSIGLSRVFSWLYCTIQEIMGIVAIHHENFYQPCSIEQCSNDQNGSTWVSIFVVAGEVNYFLDIWVFCLPICWTHQGSPSKQGRGYPISYSIWEYGQNARDGRLQVLKSVDSWYIWNPGYMRSHGEYCISFWKWRLQNLWLQATHICIP